MLLIYSPYQSPRLDYIFKFIFGSLAGINFRCTTNYNEYEAFDGPKLSYSEKKTEGGLWVTASDLLFSESIKPIIPEIAETSWGKVLFPTAENKRIPFDIFAASFYIVSRYEEYLPFEPDSLGRFKYSSSVLYKANVLSQPIINIWVKNLTRIIAEKYPHLKGVSSAFHFISSIDIDNAFAYREKGFVRNIGGLFRSLFHGKFSEITERIQVLSGKIQDPYDTYSFIKQIHSQYKVTPKVFVLNGKYGTYDKNIPATNHAFKKIIKELSAESEMGIHPSFGSNHSFSYSEEKLSLETIIEKPVSISRQHFIMLRFPETYTNLIKNGIRADFSMGYAEIAGYRAGTCSPFTFFDLKTNMETALVIYPFCWMDRTLRQHLKLSPEEAMKFISENISVVKEYGGTFVSLWHNESLSDRGYWKGWKNVFEHMMKKAIG